MTDMQNVMSGVGMQLAQTVQELQKMNSQKAGALPMASQEEAEASGSKEEALAPEVIQPKPAS